MGDDDRDLRRKPRRGVRIDPLPTHMHREFSRFVSQLDAMIQSHISTYALADREGADRAHFDAVEIYWRSARKFLRHAEYLGTRNGARKGR
jgi:hypothetical protein